MLGTGMRSAPPAKPPPKTTMEEGGCVQTCRGSTGASQSREAFEARVRALTGTRPGW